MTPRPMTLHLVHSDYSEKWPVTYPAAASLHHRKEGSR